MRRVFSLVSGCLLIAFGAWCFVSLRLDLSRISVTPLWHSWPNLLLALLLSLSHYSLRAFRWCFYLKRLGYSLTHTFSVLSYFAGFAFTVSPGKLGEIARTRYYLGKIPLREIAAATGVERVVDLLAVSALSMMILTMHPAYQYAIWVGVVIIAAVLISLSLLSRKAVHQLVASLHRLPASLTDVVGEIVSALWSARMLISPRVLAIGSVVGIVGWCFEGLELAVVGSLFAPAHIPATIAIGIYATATLVGAILFLPGGVGGTEAVMTALLVTRGYALGDAILVTIVCRILTLWLAVSIGWIAIAVLRYGRFRDISLAQIGDDKEYSSPPLKHRRKPETDVS
jgi:glycosyltransferase 2 family protein